MGYLFDPDNWEWLFTSNKFQFLLEGFLVNVQIALIALVLSLLFGLALALGDSRTTSPSPSSSGWGSTCGATCRCCS